MELIRELVHLRPATYGYRRIHAITKLIGEDCNPKTVNRYMALNLWLSTNRYKRLRRGRIHEGVVSVTEPQEMGVRHNGDKGMERRERPACGSDRLCGQAGYCVPLGKKDHRGGPYWIIEGSDISEVWRRNCS